MPDSSDVLEILSSNHLLHLEGRDLRFAHQRFQEYFSATQLYRVCLDGSDKDISLLHKAANEPSWEDSFILVADKLRGADKYKEARSRLIKAAFKIDIGFACDLVGKCLFSENDDKELYDDLVLHIESICDSPVQEIADYGMDCLMSSELSNLSDKIWPLIENDDEQIRLKYYRTHRRGISINQLGKGAAKRISEWTPERQAEFVSELSNNAENFDYLNKVANESTDNIVRESAIFSLDWNFPASDAALQAWLNAPIEVQFSMKAINAIEYAECEFGISEEVRKRIKFLSKNCTDENIQLKLVRTFPDMVDEGAVAVILNELRENDRHRNDKPLVSFVTKYAKDKLLDLASELVLSERRVPEWVHQVMKGETEEIRSKLFEKAWGCLTDENPKDLDIEVLVHLASKEQLAQCIKKKIDLECSTSLSEKDRELLRRLGKLLLRCPGDTLFNFVTEIGGEANYHEASELLELLCNRLDRENTNIAEREHWCPSVEQVYKLITVFGNQEDEDDIPQNRLNINLCTIASIVDPEEFGDLIIDTCYLFFDAWDIYQEILEKWLKEQNGPRPSKPYLGNSLIDAIVNWGFLAIPRLIELLNHQQAKYIIPVAISRIVGKPWKEKSDGIYQTIISDAKCGEERRANGRVLLQPDDVHQEDTDVVAKALSNKLKELVDLIIDEKILNKRDWNERNAAYRIKGSIEPIVNIPSREIVEPVKYALANGVYDIYTAVRTLRGLLRQGLFIEDIEVVERIEKLFQDEISADWIPENERYVLSELCQVMLYVRPSSLLNKSVRYYIEQWIRFDHIGSVIRSIGGISSKDSWEFLLYYAKEQVENNKKNDEVIYSIVNSLSEENISEFFGIISDGTLFKLNNSTWCLERNAPNIANVIRDNQKYIDMFLSACKKAPSRKGDILAASVLNILPNSDHVIQEYGLTGLDSGIVQDGNDPIYEMLKGVFTYNEQLEENGFYEVHTKSCNELRRELYMRAKNKGKTGEVSRMLLAEVEHLRRHQDRPPEENRHPYICDNVRWTDIFEISI